jgi:hypothetical protein
MGKLEINATGSNFAPLVSDTQSATTSVVVVNDGNLKLKYTTTVQHVVGDLCAYLDMRIYASSSQIFGGTFTNGMVLPDVTLASSSIWQYDFETILTFDNKNLQNKDCSFDLIFTSWQEELPNSTAGGYTDKTSVHLIVYSGEWEDEVEPAGGCMKINEVYYDPDSSHGDGNDEWIELYNACSEEVNLKDWYLKDNHDTEIIHQNYPIAPGGFVLLAANASLWNTYWSIVPTNAVKISLGSGSAMFNNLANDGDRVKLYNASSTLVDAMSYGDDKSYFSLPEPSPINDKGRSISRKIKGVDTDLADNWQYLLIPTPYSE